MEAASIVQVTYVNSNSRTVVGEQAKGTPLDTTNLVIPLDAKRPMEGDYAVEAFGLG